MLYDLSIPLKSSSFFQVTRRRKESWSVARPKGYTQNVLGKMNVTVAVKVKEKYIWSTWEGKQGPPQNKQIGRTRYTSQ